MNENYVNLKYGGVMDNGLEDMKVAPATADPPAEDTGSSRAASTRATLLAVARGMFADMGYHAAGTNDLVSRASVTRGALYYHFTDKRDLFEAVFRQITHDLNQAASAVALAGPQGTWGRLIAATRAYLRIVADSAEIRQVLLIDGPAVLGWQRWREIQSENMVDSMARALLMLMDQKVIAVRAPQPLAQLLLAALNDAAMSIAHAEDREQALALRGDALIALIEGLRQTPGG